MDRFLQDLRYAARTLTAQKGFTLVVVLTLALAVAANSTLFTILHAFCSGPCPSTRRTSSPSCGRPTRSWAVSGRPFPTQTTPPFATGLRASTGWQR